MNKIIIKLEGGIVTDVTGIPKDSIVIVFDYDHHDDDAPEDLSLDSNGREKYTYTTKWNHNGEVK